MKTKVILCTLMFTGCASIGQVSPEHKARLRHLQQLQDNPYAEWGTPIVIESHTEEASSEPCTAAELADCAIKYEQEHGKGPVPALLLASCPCP